MKKGVWVSILLVSVLLLSCAPASPPAASPAASSETRTAAARGEWETLVAAAQKEGTLVIVANMIPKARDALTSAFRSKYGINVEWVVGRPAELVAKIKAERNAGLSSFDVGFLGRTPLVNDIKPMGIALPLEPMLVLSEVKDPKNWRRGNIPYMDKDKIGIDVCLFANSLYHRNVNMVGENEILASLDLLNPKWKEKMVMSDPSISGAANAWFTWLVVGILGKEKGLQFMKDLVAQKPVMMRDERLLTESVAKGKYAIGIAPSMSAPAEFIQMGAPIAFIDVKEPRSLSAGWAVISAFKDAPHPAAARLFVNWLLSKEGGTIFAPAAGYASTRVDVPPEGILPIMVPRAGDEDPELDTPNYIQMKGDMQKVAAEIFAPLVK